MANVDQFNFTTGPSSVPAIGTLSYNGCIFSPLFETNVAGVVVKDAANRTTKWMEYTIVVDGYVTLPAAAANIDSNMATLRRLLTAQAGTLLYTGRGNSIVVNQAGGIYDVAWGPIPELLDFQPLGGTFPGGGRSAKVKWAVKTRIPEVTAPTRRGNRTLLQFNQETAVTYDEAGYSHLVINGTLEIPLTRNTQATRTIDSTADDFREQFLDQVANSFDLTRFRVTNREFKVSRDKRTMEWSFAAEELPYMGLPPGMTIARGNYTVRPAKAGMGLCEWLCTLRATYTVRKDVQGPRRLAWEAFLALVRLRMHQATLFGRTPELRGNQNQSLASIAATGLIISPTVAAGQLFNYYRQLNQRYNAMVNSVGSTGRKAWIIDFNFDEGLYLDSKTVTFSVTWRLITVFNRILFASGIWKKVQGDNENWKIAMRDIQGWASWEKNRLNPNQDIIVDFGGP